MSGGFNPINMVSQVALAAVTGGTSLIAQIAMQVVSQIAKEVIQQVGQQLGLPQPMIDAAQGAFDAAAGNPAGAAREYQEAAGGFAQLALGQKLGNLGQELGLSHSETRELQQTGTKHADQLKQQILQQIRDGDGIEQEGGRKSGLNRGSSGGSWLMVLAEALGRKANAAAETLKSKSDSLDWEDPKQSSDFNAMTQQFSMLMNAINNAIKSVGEGLTTMARKG